MINNISWGSYAIGMALLITGYYIVIGILYYRPEIQQLFKGKILLPEFFCQTSLEKQIEASDEELFPEVHLLMIKVHQVINNAAATTQEKSDLIHELQLLISNYNHLSETPFRKKINHVITKECIKQCAITMSEEEVNGLWNF
jgi:hypothetical protein